MEGNIQRIYELFLTQQGSQPLHKHSSLAKSKWEELVFIISTWKRQLEDLKVLSFLANEPKNQILSAHELPPLNITFRRLSRIWIDEV